VRQSKRTGDFITLDELIDEIGPDPIRFMLLTRTVDSKLALDLDLAKEHSDKNPVYYVQYAQRAASPASCARPLRLRLNCRRRRTCSCSSIRPSWR